MKTTSGTRVRRGGGTFLPRNTSVSLGAEVAICRSPGGWKKPTNRCPLKGDLKKNNKKNKSLLPALHPPRFFCESQDFQAITSPPALARSRPRHSAAATLPRRRPCGSGAVWCGVVWWGGGRCLPETGGGRQGSPASRSPPPAPARAGSISTRWQPALASSGRAAGPFPAGLLRRREAAAAPPAPGTDFAKLRALRAQPGPAPGQRPPAPAPAPPGGRTRGRGRHEPRGWGRGRGCGCGHLPSCCPAFSRF